MTKQFPRFRSAADCSCFGVGIAFNVLVWFPEGTFNWDVLTLIGSALLVLNIARRLPVPSIIFAAAMIIAVSPALRVLTDYPAYWEIGI